ncbi:oxidoreductase (plasmid) [Pseudonocardia sp. EC080610-09]|uniref:NAD(P)/FAD-dependent oxidoreductase n=1 Tax=unclassified Pseudonocardia TaxID=2619320 RepID=UPI000705D8F7|nr:MULTISPECIES: FAD-dependent oxidoreductase [unclassified Pseudonocardia]ALL79276.1 oxidoreductase [Pseudonocardia sp. EC080610-09]ALL85246.1 oxidoreductase [Pseudonocardia sp. EC080619-01]
MDVDVVVGAGVIGASVALELARCGRDVVVVDKAGGVGHGSTSSSSAVVRFNFSTRAGVATAWESQHCWQHWGEHLGCDVGELVRFERCGLAMLDVELAPRAAYVNLFDEIGVAYEEWDSTTLRSRIPGIDAGRHWPPKPINDERFWDDPTDQLGAVYTPDAGYIADPQLATQNLATAATHHGAQFRLRTAVVGIDTADRRVTGVRLDDGSTIACRTVVNAAGPWSGALNRLAGVGSDFTIGLRPLRQEVAYATAPAGFSPPGSPGISIADMDLGTYLRGELGGGLLIGGTEPECDPLHWLDDPDQAHPHPTAAVFDAQVTRAARRLTELAVPSRPRGVVGVYDVTDDWTPIYDRTELDGFYVAIGTSGNQFKNAPLAGKFLTTIIEHVEDGHDHDARPVQFVGRHTGHTIDLGAFSRRRKLNTGTSGTVMG